MLVFKNANICVTPNANATICVTPNVNPQREQVEYIGDVGSPTRGACVGHVNFMLFVSFLVALGTLRKRGIQWKTGFRLLSFQRVIFDNLLTRF